MNCLSKNVMIKGILALGLASFLVVSSGCAVNTASPENAASREASTAAAPRQITEIVTQEEDQGCKVIIKGSQELVYTSVKQPHPLGVVLYFPETQAENVTYAADYENEVLGPLNISWHDPSARVEIPLKADVPYQVARQGNDLCVVFQKSSQAGSIPSGGETAREASLQTGGGVPASQLEAVKVNTRGEYMEIAVLADGEIADYNAFTIENPARIVFDIFKLKSPYQKEQKLKVDSRWIRQVRHYCYPDRLRLVVDTTEECLSRYEAAPASKGLLIKLNPPAGTIRLASAENSLQGMMAAPASSRPVEKPQSDRPSNGEAAYVNRIDFIAQEKGKSTLVVGTTAPVEYELQKVTNTRLLLKLRDTRLPEYRKRPMITTRFDSAIDRIIPMQTPAMKHNTHLSIELREAVPYFVEQDNGLLQLHFEASSVPPKPEDQAKLPSWKRVLEQTESILIGKNGQAAGTAREEAEAPAPFSREKKYVGEKIALDFYETDIKNVFRILREVSGKNFAIDKDVTGKVTMTIEKPVPWDQILDLILKMNQLGQVSEGNIVRIATLATLKNEEDLRQAKMMAEQKAREQESQLEPIMTAYLPVSYANAKAEVLPHVLSALSLKPGESEVREGCSATVDERNNQLIVRDTAIKIQEIREIVKRIDQVTPQVIIEARIVEVTQTFKREFGIQWLAQDNNILGGVDTVLGYDAMVNFPGGLGLNTDFGSIGINFSRLVGSPIMLDAQLRAMESEGEAKIISAPRVITLDNKEALIRQILEYPVIKEIDEETNEITYELKPLDLALTVTPHITPDGRISMNVKIDKDDIGAIINNWQSFVSKEAQTELLVNNSDTIVIGGIFKSSVIDETNNIPGFGNVPVLKWLFGNTAKEQRNEELLIFITPKIVQLEQVDMS